MFEYKSRSAPAKRWRLVVSILKQAILSQFAGGIWHGIVALTHYTVKDGRTKALQTITHKCTDLCTNGLRFGFALRNLLFRLFAGLVGFILSFGFTRFSWHYWMPGHTGTVHRTFPLDRAVQSLGILFSTKFWSV